MIRRILLLSACLFYLSLNAHAQLLPTCESVFSCSGESQGSASVGWILHLQYDDCDDNPHSKNVTCYEFRFRL